MIKIYIKDGEVVCQTEAKNDSIAHSLSISPDGTHLTFAVQRYINPLESDEVKTKIQNESDPNFILRFDSNLGERNEIKMKQGDYPLASHWIHQTKENTAYYSTSGDGTCIKWKGKGLITMVFEYQGF